MAGGGAGKELDTTERLDDVDEVCPSFPYHYEEFFVVVSFLVMSEKQSSVGTVDPAVLMYPEC